MLKALLAAFHRSANAPSARGYDTNNEAVRLIAAGRAAEDDGHLDKACMHYRRAIALAPDDCAAHLNLGITLAAMGNFASARVAYHAVLALDPSHALAHYNLGNLLYSQREFAEAERFLRTALESRNEFPEAHVALSNVLDSLGRVEDALEHLDAALQDRPDYLGALFNRGMLLNKLRRFEDAEDAMRSLLELDPCHLGAAQVLAVAVWGQGRWSEALELFRSLRGKVPWSPELESSELFLLNYDDRLSIEEVFQRHCDYGARLENAIPVRFTSFPGDASDGRRLRIGYVSADFNWHPVALFILPVLAHHNRDKFEVFCYYNARKVDQVTRELRSYADHWIDTAALSDSEFADAIYRDRIDLLVDLSGHTSGNRLPAFAQQPAPVQMTWLGYLNTTGLTRIQYRLCDARTDPQCVSDSLHTEKLVRLPQSQWCYRPFIHTQIDTQTPWVRNGYVTFGSFNHTMKISAAVCAQWAEILAKIPESQLVCVGLTSSRKMAELLSELTMTGVDPARIQMVARTNLSDYFAWFKEVDIALDTFPYGGGTTTFDALWMGTPVVAAKGATPTSRSAASILAALELREWIAPSINDYVRVAVERANDRAAISELRSSLRARLQASPLMDEKQFVRDLEAAYRRMWRAWCAKATGSHTE